MSGRPHIAVLIDWYLPGTHAGGPVRSVFSLVELLKSDFNFTVITTDTDLGSGKPYTGVTPDKLFQRDGVSYYYFSREGLKAGGMGKLLTQLAPDLVYLNSFWSYHFSINVVRLKAKGRITAPVLLAPRGMLGKGAMGLKHFKKRAFLTLARLMGWYRRVGFHATQSIEQDNIRDEFPAARVFVAPNVNALKPVQAKDNKTGNDLKLFFLSRISRVKNLKFALELLAHTDARYRITYDIWGNIEDPAYWKECEAVISSLPAHVTVACKGELPFDRIQPVLAQYHALWLPTLNENYGHAIVESLLCGCAVVISDQTPWNDVNAAACGFALPLDRRQQFTAALNQLASLDAEGFRQMSRRAIDYISQKIDLASIAEKYKSMFYGCIQNQPGKLR